MTKYHRWVQIQSSVSHNNNLRRGEEVFSWSILADRQRWEIALGRHKTPGGGPGSRTHQMVAGSREERGEVNGWSAD